MMTSLTLNEVFDYSAEVDELTIYHAHKGGIRWALIRLNGHLAFAMSAVAAALPSTFSWPFQYVARHRWWCAELLLRLSALYGVEDIIHTGERDNEP